jgi:hypothetical protein
MSATLYGMQSERKYKWIGRRSKKGIIKIFALFNLHIKINSYICSMKTPKEEIEEHLLFMLFVEEMEFEYFYHLDDIIFYSPNALNQDYSSADVSKKFIEWKQENV